MPEWCPEDKKGVTGECLWRVEGHSVYKDRWDKFVGLIRAPSREVALTIAQTRYASSHKDLCIRGEPLTDRDFTG